MFSTIIGIAPVPVPYDARLEPILLNKGADGGKKMKKFCLAIGLVALFMCPAAFADVTMTFVTDGGYAPYDIPGVGDAVVGPYSLTVGGQAMNLFCIDVNHSVDPPTTWQATPTNETGNQFYEEMAWLVEQASLPGETQAQIAAIQYAIWYIGDSSGITVTAGDTLHVDPGDLEPALGGVTPSVSDLVSEAEAAVNGGFSTGVTAYIPNPYTVEGSGQIFITVPEPGLIVLLSIGLFGANLLAFRLRK
jgi:hypothetical protein